MQNQMNYHSANEGSCQSQTGNASPQSGATVPEIRILSSWLERRPNLIRNSLRLL